MTTLRASAVRWRERAAKECDAGRAQYARRHGAQADALEFRAESRESRAEVVRVELRAVQAELRRAGGWKVGSWLRKAGGGDSRVSSHTDPLAGVH